jgi:hypothetical protein
LRDLYARTYIVRPGTKHRPPLWPTTEHGDGWARVVDLLIRRGFLDTKYRPEGKHG